MKHTTKHQLQTTILAMGLAYWSVPSSAPKFSNDRGNEIGTRVREGDGYA